MDHQPNQLSGGQRQRVAAHERRCCRKRGRVVAVIQKVVTAEGAAISEADVAAAVPTKTTKPAEAAPAASTKG
jgi:hypothetical protein